jgi:signal recognition particle subunit SRP54
MFASAGEKLADFDVFHPDRMASRILDLGDMLTLIEQAERAFDQEQAARMAGKLVSGDGFTLEDFVDQLNMVRKLGPIGNLLGMLPGAAQNRELLSQISDKDLDRAAAIVNSMTPEERRNPKIINGSRRARIAAGSGVTVSEVNSLVTRFFEGQKMMRQMLGGGGIPGMPPIPGMRRAVNKAAKGKKGKKKPKGGRPGASPARSGRPGQDGRGADGHGGPGAGGLGADGFGAAGRGAGSPGGVPPGLAGLGGAPGAEPGAGPGLPAGLPSADLLRGLKLPSGPGGAASQPGNVPAGFKRRGQSKSKRGNKR